MNEVGYWLKPSFPRQCCVVIVILSTMTPSDSLSSIYHFVFTYRFLLYFLLGSDEEGIPSSVNYFPNMSLPLPREIPRCCYSKFFTPSMVFTHILKVRLLLSHQRWMLLTRRQDSLHVTTC